MSSERIHYLDWLKVVIVYGIVLFHVSLVFSFGTWLVSNHERSIILSAFAGFTFPWGIPAMFLIAGADAWFGLHSHSVADFLRRRFLRLVVPLVPGLLLVSPFQRFVSSSNPPPSIDTFWAFYASFFRSFHFSWTLQFISQYWLHLWFLAYLFAITLACAPVLMWLRKPAGRRLTSWLVAIACRRGGVLVLAAPLVLTQLVLRPRFPAYQDWADVATFTLAFLWGAIFFSDRRFEAAIRRQVPWLLAGGTLSMLGIGLLTYFTRIHAMGDARAQVPAQLAESFLWSLFVWSWLLVVLYAGIRWLNFPNRRLRYAEKSILPVYVIHHPVVLLVASFVVTWDFGVWPKFAVILVSVATLTLGIYEFGVRRWRVTRLMFGLNAVAVAPTRPSPLSRAPAREQKPEGLKALVAYGPWPSAGGMKKARGERRAPQVNPDDASAAGFAERHLDYRHDKLRSTWTACPACGGDKLRFPRAADRRRIPEADGFCGTCGVALMATADGKPLVLTPRQPRRAS